jgi:group I intron endonuclease
MFKEPEKIPMMGIYQIRNLLNDKVYIGSSQELKKRWSSHRSALRRNSHPNKHLQNSVNLYGEDSFSFEILQIIYDIDKLLLVEQGYLDEYLPEYNISIDAKSGMRGRYVSKMTKENLSKMQMGENNSFYNKVHTEDSKNKMSKSRLGLSKSESTKLAMKNSWTDERRKNQSEKVSGENNGFFDKHHSQETKDKLQARFSGEGSANAKLTWKLVRCMRGLYSTGDYTYADLADLYDISPHTVSGIIRFTRWKE